MIRFAAVAIALVTFGGAAWAETPAERGSYLVNTIMTCGNCHSPKGPPAAIAGKDSGPVQVRSEEAATAAA